MANKNIGQVMKSGRPEEEAAVVGFGVAAIVFYPEHETRAAIHHEVCPLVDEGHIVEGCLRKIGEEGKHPHADKTKDRKRVFSCKMREKGYNLLHFFHFYFLFLCKSRKN